MTLTPKQIECFDIIQASLDRLGRAPTVREIARCMGTQAHSAADEHICSLVSKGYLMFEFCRGFRMIRIVKRPERRATLLLCIGAIS